MKRSWIVIFLLMIAGGVVHAFTTPTEEPIDLDALYQQIDEAISQSPQYVAEKERQIAGCRDSLLIEKSLEKRVQMAERLFMLYQPYKNDSALHYAELCISLADSLRRSDLVGRFRSMMAYQCSNSDLYNESLDQLRMVDKTALDNQGLCEYYNAWMHVCGEIGHYTQRPDVQHEYYHLQNLYRDSVLMVAEKDSEHYLHLKVDVLNARQQYQDALKVSDEWFHKIADKTHESAYAAFYRSMVYEKLENHDMVRYWLGQSALEDIQCAVMNQASLLFLAEHLLDDGDTERAQRYMEYAKDCNLFFCPLLRNYQVHSVIKVLESNSQAAQARANLILYIAIGVIVLIIMALLIVFVIRKKQT